MITSEIQATTSTNSPSPTSVTVTDDHPFSFHHILSALNPLQYLPVVGTIYRSLTGDVIPEALRRAGSLVVSGLLGGPIGLIVNIGSTIAEKITGLDPEKIVAAQFTKAHPTATTSPAEMVVEPPVAMVAVRLPLSSEQLAAYGVRSGLSGASKFGDSDGADVLNGIELTRLGKVAAAAYTANQPVPIRSVPALQTASPVQWGGTPG
jgi:hypothetical protein